MPKPNPYVIQRIIRKRVNEWQNQCPGIWSWPHDSFANESWGYAIHAASVGAWNDEGRQTECATFLLQWATITNIKAALKANRDAIANM